MWEHLRCSKVSKLTVRVKDSKKKKKKKQTNITSTPAQLEGNVAVLSQWPSVNFDRKYLYEDVYLIHISLPAYTIIFLSIQVWHLISDSGGTRTTFLQEMMSISSTACKFLLSL